MITASRQPIEEGRVDEALALLESSGYDERWKSQILDKILTSSPDEIDIIIQDLLLNQVDKWSSYRMKDINKRLNHHADD